MHDPPRVASEYGIMRSDFLSRFISGQAPGAPRLGGRHPTDKVQDNWSSLMEAAQSGDGGAYKRLLVGISEWLQLYFQPRLPPGEVDDAVQETMLAVHRRRHTYDPRYPLGPWLAAIAKNKWVDQLRALGRRPADGLSDDIPTGDHEASVVNATVLAGLLGELPPAQAQAILLVKVQGYSVEEASLQTGLSSSALKMNILAASLVSRSL